MAIEHFVSPSGLPPVSGYSHAVVAEGRVISVSGQLPLDTRGQLVGDGDPLTQARQVFANLLRALEAAGARSADLVRLGIYLIDLTDLPVVRRARDELVDVSGPPTSSLIQVSGLVVPGARLEVDGLAVVAPA